MIYSVNDLYDMLTGSAACFSDAYQRFANYRDHNISDEQKKANLDEGNYQYYTELNAFAHHRSVFC